MVTVLISKYILSLWHLSFTFHFLIIVWLPEPPLGRPALFQVPAFYFFSLLTDLQSLLLIDQNPSLPTVLPPIYIHTNFCWNFSSYFMLIALVFLRGLLPSTFFFSIMSFKTAPEVILFSYISITISSNHFTLLSSKWGTTNYKAQISLLTFICFQSILLPKSFSQSPQLLISRVGSLTFSIFYPIGFMARIISSFCPFLLFVHIFLSLFKICFV